MGLHLSITPPADELQLNVCAPGVPFKSWGIVDPEGQQTWHNGTDLPSIGMSASV